MASTSTTRSSFKIDNNFSGFGTKYNYYRIIINTTDIKYLALLPGSAPSIPDSLGERLGFTTVPDGIWNVAYPKRGPGAEGYVWDSATEQFLATIQKIWHPQKIDYLDLGKECVSSSRLQSEGQIFSAVYSQHFGVDQVVVNIEWCPESVYGVDHETEIYALIDHQGIAPKFLAHITENKNRVIGFMVEMVPARPATIGDLSACRTVLAKLHSLGIAHGSLRDTNFLVIDDNDTALLQGFAGSYQTEDKNVLDAERDSLEGLLRDAKQHDIPMQKIGPKLAAELRAISNQEGGIHPLLIEETFRDGKITMTLEEHREMLEDLKKNGWKKPIDT